MDIHNKRSSPWNHSQESQCKYFHPPCRSPKQLSDYQNDLSTTYHKESEKHEPFCRWIWFQSSCRSLFRNKYRLRLRFLLNSIGLPDYFCHCITKARRISHESVARETSYTNSMLKKHIFNFEHVHLWIRIGLCVLPIMVVNTNPPSKQGGMTQKSVQNHCLNRTTHQWNYKSNKVY